MSDFGNCEAIFAEIGGWGVELPLAGDDLKVEAVEVVKLTPAPELQCNALSNQAQENDTQQSFFRNIRSQLL